jgi:hypothetical protein
MMRHNSVQPAHKQQQQQQPAVDITQFDWGTPFSGQCSAWTEGVFLCRQDVRNSGSRLSHSANWLQALIYISLYSLGHHLAAELGCVHQAGWTPPRSFRCCVHQALWLTVAACLAAGVPLAVPRPRSSGSGEEQGLTPQSSAVLSPLAGSEADGADFWSPRDGSGQHMQSAADSSASPVAEQQSCE